MTITYDPKAVTRALESWPFAHGFDAAPIVPVEIWRAGRGLGLVLFKAPTTRAQIMADLRKRYPRDLLGARLFDEYASILFLKRGEIFPPRQTRAEVLAEARYREMEAARRHEGT